MTENIVDAVEAQHRSLERVVREIQAAVDRQDAAAASEKLTQLKQLLVAHLALENAQFYPRFVELAARQPRVLKVAELFQTNMKTIAEGVMVFFERYEGKPVDFATFTPEWNSTVKTLAARIQQEEQTLHPMFRRLQPR